MKLNRALKKLSKKGYSLSALWSFGLIVVILVVSLAIGVKIVAQMNESETNADARTILEQGITSLGDLSDWIPIIVIVVVGAIILTILVRAFAPLGFGSASMGE